MTKKLLTLAAAAAFATCAYADAPTLYAVGDFQDWNIGDPVALAYDEATDLYTLAQPQIQTFKLSTEIGGWDEFNAAAYTADITENGVECELVAGSDNIALPWTGDYTITVSLTNHTIKAVTTTPKPTTFDIYLRGSMNGWDASDDWKFSTVDNKTFTIEGVTLSATDEWKVADSSWGAINYGAAINVPVGFDVDFQLKNGSQTNCKLAVDGENINLTFNLETGIIVVTQAAGIGEITTWDAPAAYFNLQGMPIHHPEAGCIYIVKRGTKVMKQIVL